MASRRYIGTIDLTARLSSMNPYMYDDPKEANLRFEKILIEVCSATHLHSNNKQALERDGIIKGGDVPAGFEFEHLEDFVFFVGQVRWALLDARLPFKLCANLGANIGRTMEEIWGARVSADAPPFSPEVKAEAKARFGTDDPKKIALIISLYRSAAATDDSALLKTNLENFKGFGLWIDRSVVSSAPSIEHAFLNYCPVKVAKGYELNEYYDFRLPISPQDTIQRYEGGDDRMGSGCSVLIAQVLDMMRRSMKPDDQNGAYYASLLNCFVHSSSYDQLLLIEEVRAPAPRDTSSSRAHIVSRTAHVMAGTSIALTVPGDGEVELKAGWQGYPPIFEAILLKPQFAALLRRVPGVEIILGSLMMRIHEREPSDALLEGASCEETPSTPKATSIDLDPILVQTIKAAEAVYGERIIRKVLRLPPEIVSQAVKKAILKIGNLSSE